MNFESKQLFSRFIDVRAQDVPAYIQKLDEAEKNAHQKASEATIQYEPCFNKFKELHSSLAQINDLIKAEEESINQLEMLAVNSHADVSAIIEAMDRKEKHESKLKTLSIARDNLEDEIVIFKAASYRTYSEYVSAIRHYKMARTENTTGKFIFAIREVIDRSIIECENSQHGITEVVHLSAFDYIKNITPSNGMYNPIAMNLAACYGYKNQTEKTTTYEFNDYLGKYYTDFPGSEYESSILISAERVINKRKG
ncbi:hypothetical protein GJV07_02620 [Enterobacteriaceae bacterium RIT711]|nr:hypothetical protein [Enterobacteriaceae bacterium RIT711]